MTQFVIFFEEPLTTQVIHLENKCQLLTDAPKDHGGNAEQFSPTDLFAISLGSCMATVMGLYAKNKKISLQGLKIQLEKSMANQPRRIGKIKVDIHMPDIPNEQRAALEKAALNCPVHHSIHPDTQLAIQFFYPD